MNVLGIDTSCDECAAAVVRNGEIALSNVVATQIPFHAPYNGVVPEIAGRKHAEWIGAVVAEALRRAGIGADGLDAVAVSNRPGLLGALIVGLSFAKSFAWARGLPLIAVDHMKAHLYAARLRKPGESESAVPPYPFLGLLVSGGHTIICRADGFDEIRVLGATVDDAAGEAFDKVAKHHGFGYPGGQVIDKLAREGDEGAFRFPMPTLKKGQSRCDVSYSGLKNAAINQLDKFRASGASGDAPPADIAASFQKTAVDILLRALFEAAGETGLSTAVLGGGVAANSRLRALLGARADIKGVFPAPEFCADNGAMVAGIGYRYLIEGKVSGLDATASARVQGFKSMGR
ncbi:MAG: tRNA (adenosine(37)-N6)-threonylcarbamoyltransferase complex transferase subunit TsaD [Treponema sp.]|nr:tRNA (adenosine(37)-N6)-threonylcarbamoyltransferase complex transferase subunit TsaD [Treponema sp.]